MYNKVIILGRVTQDLELKTTPSGVSVLSFSIAADRRYQQKGEEHSWQDYRASYCDTCGAKMDGEGRQDNE